MKKVIENLPIGWTEKQLKDNNTFMRRGKSPIYSEDDQGLFVVNQDCIRWNCVNLEKVKYHVVPNQIDDSFYLREGDILINSTGTGTIGRVNQWSYSDVQAVADSHVTVLRTTEDSIDSTYARYFLTSELGQRYLESVCYTGSTNQIELSKRYFSKLKLPCAPLPEQKAIAGILSTVDESIEAIENSILSAECLKKSLMQNLLIGKLKPDWTWRKEDEFYNDDKLGKIPKGWSVVKGNIITTKIAKGQSPKWQGFDYQSSGILFITSENVRDGYIDVSKPKYLPIEFNNKIKNSQLIKGDILINIVGASIGRCAVYDLNVKCANTNQAVCVFRSNEGNDSKFLAYYLQTDKTQRRLLGSQVETARANLSLSDFRKFKFVIPESLTEQVLIAENIDKVNNIVVSKNAKVKTLKSLKKSLMQNLLTGKVRVDVDKINKLLDKA
ncbi:restriction endonuclease subunit S [Psychrobacter sp. AH5]|uniref:restriction endonuclease subunit S n=1 Tax=Psychrobacter sp. AH5 TaxID=2937433 RepID=UPI003341F0B1